MVRAIQSLPPNIEETSFEVGTDHNAIRQMLTCNDSQGRLMRWRVLLREFDYEGLYPPVLVRQLRDAL